jgi:hypothetical protein
MHASVKFINDIKPLMLTNISQRRNKVNEPHRTIGFVLKVEWNLFASFSYFMGDRDFIEL